MHNTLSRSVIFEVLASFGIPQKFFGIIRSIEALPSSTFLGHVKKVFAFRMLSVYVRQWTAIDKKLRLLIYYGEQVSLRVNFGKSVLMLLNLHGNLERQAERHVEEISR